MTTSSGETKRWFYVREGRRHGPVETARLVDLVLGGEVPEDSLVWHSGLPEWLPARDVEDIRRELPPPVPTRPSLRLPSPCPGTPPAEAELPDAEGEDVRLGRGLPPDRGPTPKVRSNGQKRRRKRKHRHRDSKQRPPWLWPLIVVLIGADDLPVVAAASDERGPARPDHPDRLASRSSPAPRAASASRWAASPGSAPGSRPARPA